MLNKNLIKSGLFISSLVLISSCGIEIYEDSSPMVRESGQLTVVNETYDDQIKVEVALAEIDRGHIANLHVEPKGRSVRGLASKRMNVTLTLTHSLANEPFAFIATDDWQPIAMVATYSK